jgi:hypothetical protein
MNVVLVILRHVIEENNHFNLAMVFEDKNCFIASGLSLAKDPSRIITSISLSFWMLLIVCLKV